MRRTIDFNQDWLYSPNQLPMIAPDREFTAITLPHTNRLFSHNDVDNRDYQFISTYRKHFSYHPESEEEQVFLDFEGVMLACKVYLNGQFLLEHLGGYDPFSVELTPSLEVGKNTLTVYVDSRERKDIPPYGHLVDYLTFGGIYRDVTLRIANPTHIENLFVRTNDVLTDPWLDCQVQLNRIEPNLALTAILTNSQGNEIAIAQKQVYETIEQIKIKNLQDIGLWSLDNPSLYTVQITLEKDDEVLDVDSARFGFRKAEFRPDGGFYLNNEQIKLFGLNRHQTYPFIGAAAPIRLQRLDADILKFELACNIVRTSHYPQSRHFLDRCDEIGLLVFEEITGWQHIGDKDWQSITLSELQSMIERDRNHPAIILWGVRVNKSPDDDPFYKRTNALAHQLDPSRQTGGVRCFRDSSFLEDVYTYNDFSNSILDPDQIPYLITEFSGHMFPTKIWDHEERLIDHALLHAKIQNGQIGNPGIAGAIGWSAFDYATHKEFGSGDRVCYHGVMDIYRLPKWAAFFYQSQQDPSRKIVLQAATHWTMGDRNGGGNNPLTVFSNCEEVEVIIGENNLGKFKPDYKTYPNLEHPPFTIPVLEKYSAWGQSEFYDLHIVGYIQDKQVAEQWISSNQLPTRFELSVDTDHLAADGADMTRLIFRITDEFGNPLPYAAQVVFFEIEGPADLIGENPFALVGGQAALYIKARHEAGQVIVRASTSGLSDAIVFLTIMDTVSK